MRVPRFEVIVRVSETATSTAVSPSNRDGSVTATPVAVVVPGALRRIAKLARVASTSAPINTFPATAPIAATKVKV